MVLSNLGSVERDLCWLEEALRRHQEALENRVRIEKEWLRRGPKARATKVKPALELSALQPVTRDFAFLVDRTVKAGDLVRAAQNVDKKLITGVTVFDVYEGEGIEPGKKSIAIAVTLQPRERTMTDEEIDALAAKIVGEVSKRTGGVLRA